MSHIEPLVRRTLPGCLGMQRALNLLLFWWVATALSGELSQRGGREKNHGAEDDRENGYQFHSQSLPKCVSIHQHLYDDAEPRKVPYPRLPNDPSSATRPTGRVNCKPRRHAGFA